MGSCPRVTVHYAQTLDGRIATRTGSSQWISGEASLRYAHEMRAAHDAVLVGVGTVVADNPRLTVRLAPGRSPCRVVLDSTLRLPRTAALLTDGGPPTVVATTERAPRDAIDQVGRTAEILLLNTDARGRVDLADLLARLAERGLGSVLVEGGGAIITAFLRQRLVDRLTICIAPKVLGMGTDAVGDLGILRLADAVVFSGSHFIPLGEDVVFDGRLTR